MKRSFLGLYVYEIGLWLGSVLLILVSFFIGGGDMTVLASLQDAGYYPMVICFVVFLINDFYGFINWSRMQRRQKDKKCVK